jgi:hypothetical protein
LDWIRRHPVISAILFVPALLVLTVLGLLLLYTLGEESLWVALGAVVLAVVLGVAGALRQER